jgi:hypothetical protein
MLNKVKFCFTICHSLYPMLLLRIKSKKFPGGIVRGIMNKFKFNSLRKQGINWRTNLKNDHWIYVVFALEIFSKINLDGIQVLFWDTSPICSQNKQ